MPPPQSTPQEMWALRRWLIRQLLAVASIYEAPAKKSINAGCSARSSCLGAKKCSIMIWRKIAGLGKDRAILLVCLWCIAGVPRMQRSLVVYLHDQSVLSLQTHLVYIASEYVQGVAPRLFCVVISVPFKPSF